MIIGHRAWRAPSSGTGMPPVPGSSGSPGSTGAEVDAATRVRWEGYADPPRFGCRALHRAQAPFERVVRQRRFRPRNRVSWPKPAGIRSKSRVSVCERATQECRKSPHRQHLQVPLKIVVSPVRVRVNASPSLTHAYRDGHDDAGPLLRRCDPTLRNNYNGRESVKQIPRSRGIQDVTAHGHRRTVRERAMSVQAVGIAQSHPAKERRRRIPRATSQSPSQSEIYIVQEAVACSAACCSLEPQIHIHVVELDVRSAGCSHSPWEPSRHDSHSTARTDPGPPAVVKPTANDLDGRCTGDIGVESRTGARCPDRQATSNVLGVSEIA
jgi:hypothetical protein